MAMKLASHTTRKHTLRGFEKRMVRIYELKREKVAGSWR
jgi:hypothetical protein